MKYTIEGFSQSVLVELGLDAVDAHLIRWLADFIHTGKMAEITENGNIFYWVKYAAILGDLPILGLSSADAVARRFRRITETGIFEHKTVKRGGTYAYFRLSPDGYSVLMEDTSPTQKSDPSDPKVGPPSDPKVGTNNSSIILNPSIKESRGAKAPPSRNEVHLFFDQEGFKQDPDNFYDYWESMGWKRRGGIISKWQNAARNYVRQKWAPLAPPKPRKKILCKSCGEEIFDEVCRNLSCPECPLHKE